MTGAAVHLRHVRHRSRDDAERPVMLVDPWGCARLQVWLSPCGSMASCPCPRPASCPVIHSPRDASGDASWLGCAVPVACFRAHPRTPVGAWGRRGDRYQRGLRCPETASRRHFGALRASAGARGSDSEHIQGDGWVCMPRVEEMAEAAPDMSLVPRGTRRLGGLSTGALGIDVERAGTYPQATKPVAERLRFIDRRRMRPGGSWAAMRRACFTLHDPTSWMYPLDVPLGS